MDTQDISEDLNTTIGETQSSSTSKCWAVLAPSSSSTTVPPKELVEDEVVIGRNSSCGVRLDDKRISSRHAKLYREPDGVGFYKVFIVDLSTNGTFLDRKRIAKNTPVKLQTGAEISLSPPDSNTNNSCPQLSSTISTTSNNINQSNRAADESTTLDRSDKRSHEEGSTQSPVKKQRLEHTDGTNEKPKDHTTEIEPKVKDPDQHQLKGDEEDQPRGEEVDQPKGGDRDKLEASDLKDVDNEKETGTDKASQLEENGKKGENDSRLEKDNKAGKDQKEPAKHEEEDKVEKENKEKDGKSGIPANPPVSVQANTPPVGQGKGLSSSAGASGEALIEEHLVCGICQSLFHKCVSIIPCLHNFCAYCIGEWCQRSNKCPECRQKVKGVSKNHSINNVVGGFLVAHPDKSRPRAELDEMDANCKLTDKMLLKGKLTGLAGWDNHAYDEEDDGEGEEEDSDESEHSEDEDDDDGGANACRQCRAPGADGFQCAANGPHLMCSSCNQLVPDRPPSTDPLHPIPGVRCELCSRIHCDLYWGCPIFYGKGALKVLTEYQFTTIPPHTILNNAPELQYTLDILNFNHIPGPNGMWHEMLKDLDAGKLQFNGTPTHVPVTSTKLSCQSCARSVFESLVYKWRAAVPADKVPPLVAARPFCHWGKNCRTQQHKQDHATKFNHICEQTKF